MAGNHTDRLIGLLVLVSVAIVSRPAAADSRLAERVRRPVAIVAVPDRRRLLVANHHSGTLSVIDTVARRVIAEHTVGRRLSDLAAVAGTSWLLATDESAGRLLLLEHRDDDSIVVQHQLDLGASPVSIVILPGGRRCAVASLWSRRLSIVDLADLPALRLLHSIELPFTARCQLPLPGGSRVLVADAFGGRLAVVDIDRGIVEQVRSLAAHNIRGLALEPGGRAVLVAHQVLNPLARTTSSDVLWGLLMTNSLRRVRLADLADRARSLAGSGLLMPLGEAGHPAGDPAAVAVTGSDRFVVALAGANQVGIGRIGQIGIDRVDVGARPTDLVVDSNGRHAWVAATLDDAVSLVDIATARRLDVISLGPRPAVTDVERGERLFFDARLSKDGWMSCHSCHTDGHTNGLLNDNLGDGSYGAPKRVLSLLGTVNTGPWAWNGQVSSLENQVRHSITTTMRGPEPTHRDVTDLSAYVRSLSWPAPPRISADQDVRHGERLFIALKCDRCHAPPLYTSPASYDVGLVDEVGERKFNPPSLRGVGQRPRLFHDNRARSLTEVLTRFRHQVGRTLSEEEVAELVRFLQSL